MKLRLQRDSVRFRLSEAEVAELVQAGRIEESVSFGDEIEAQLVYEVSADADLTAINVAFENGRISVSVPAASVRQWADSGDVVLTGGGSPGGAVSIIIEKDLARRRPERELISS